MKRGFARLLAANVATNTGDGIAAVVAPLLALQLTGDPLLVAGVAAASMIPWLLVAVPAGLLVDRVDRGVAFATANGARALLAVALLFLVAVDGLTIGWLYVFVLAYGAGETIADSAVRAATPALVDRAELPRANTRLEAGELIAQRFVSQPVASALFAVAALVPLGVNAVAFAVAAILALTLPRTAGHSTASHEPFRRQLTAGLRAILTHADLRALWLFGILTTVWFSAAWGSYAIRLIDGLGVAEAWYGAFLLLQGLGGLLGSVLAVPIARRIGSGRTIGLAALLIGIGITAIGTPSVAAAGAGFILSSLGILIMNVHVTSLRQALVTPDLLGRVHGTWRTCVWGAMPIGALLGGVLARIDLALPYLVGGGMYLLLTALFWHRFTRLRNLHATAPDPILTSAQ